MASKRRIRRKSCEGKKHYDSVEEANAACGRALRLFNEHLHTYKCPYRRGKYHIGHPKKDVRKSYESKLGAWYS